MIPRSHGIFIFVGLQKDAKQCCDAIKPNCTPFCKSKTMSKIEPVTSHHFQKQTQIS